MAKPFEDWIGNSCHIHSSLFRGDEPAFADDEVLFSQWLAGRIPRVQKELAVFFAPCQSVQALLPAGSWAPTTLAWGHDNRTCGYRVVGHGKARRVGARIPGGDVNPCLAFAAMIASGLHGIEQGLESTASASGNAYESDSERFPSSMRRRSGARAGVDGARRLWRPGRRPLPQLRTHRARLFDRFVTDWKESAASSASDTPRMPRAKRALDVAVSGSLLVALTPVWAAVLGAIGVDMLRCPQDRGRLLYQERRISRGRPFDLLKLRALRESVLVEAAGHVRPFERTPPISPGPAAAC